MQLDVSNLSSGYVTFTSMNNIECQKQRSFPPANSWTYSWFFLVTLIFYSGACWEHQVQIHWQCPKNNWCCFCSKKWTVQGKEAMTSSKSITNCSLVPNMQPIGQVTWCICVVQDCDWKPKFHLEVKDTVGTPVFSVLLKTWLLEVI